MILVDRHTFFEFFKYWNERNIIIFARLAEFLRSFYFMFITLFDYREIREEEFVRLVVPGQRVNSDVNLGTRCSNTFASQRVLLGTWTTGTYWSVWVNMGYEWENWRDNSRNAIIRISWITMWDDSRNTIIRIGWIAWLRWLQNLDCPN